VTSRAFHVVEMFEEAVAEFAGSRYGVAVDSCTTAIFLSLLWEVDPNEPATPEYQGFIGIPKRTYISVPHSIKRAGFGINFEPRTWQGAYPLHGTPIIDSALRFRQGMYQENQLEAGFDWPGGSDSENRGKVKYCVSFHMRKHIKIGRGGMILTDDHWFVEWAQKMRFDGRTGSIPFTQDTGIEYPGLNAYMLPEQAARGLQLLEAHDPNAPDLTPVYPDLSVLPVFQR
jgi:hypothetical protein